jgi:hypothetical protein
VLTRGTRLRPVGMGFNRSATVRWGIVTRCAAAAGPARGEVRAVGDGEAGVHAGVGRRGRVGRPCLARRWSGTGRAGSVRRATGGAVKAAGACHGRTRHRLVTSFCCRDRAAVVALQANSVRVSCTAHTGSGREPCPFPRRLHRNACPGEGSTRIQHRVLPGWDSASRAHHDGAGAGRSCRFTCGVAEPGPVMPDLALPLALAVVLALLVPRSGHCLRSR